MTSADPGAAAAPRANRVPALQGGRNFRDLGGYRTRDGRSVRHGRLYRSGSMATLTAADCATLAGFGIRLVCDLRTTAERQRAPSLWQDATAPRYWSRDYAMSFGDLRALMASGPADAAQLRAAMLAVYRQLPFEQAPAYRELFARLADGELPMVIKCSAGKDRTGLAAALVLSVLDVPHEQIVEDYLLTNELLVLQQFQQDGSRGLLSGLPADAVRAILGAEPDYLAAAFAAIEQQHGSIDSYLHDALGVGTTQRLAIRREMLE